MNNKKREAGIRQESQVSYFLNRLLGKRDEYFVLENLVLPNGEFTSQIDHLVIYKYGFIVIESKSIYGSVRINREGEWERSYENRWFGIPSPIKQAEVQIGTLRELLFDNAKDLRNKYLGMQTYFGGQVFTPIVAVSSATRLDRTSIPKDISKNIVKTEFLVDRIKEINAPSHSILKSLVNTTPAMGVDEMERTYAFLKSFEKERGSTSGMPKSTEDNSATANAEFKKAESPVSDVLVKCKKCFATGGLSGHYGRYGYYATCSSCSTNTPLKSNCPKCRSTETKTRKSKQDLFVDCQACGHQAKLSVKWAG